MRLDTLHEHPALPLPEKTLPPGDIHDDRAVPVERDGTALPGRTGEMPSRIVSAAPIHEIHPLTRDTGPRTVAA